MRITTTLTLAILVAAVSMTGCKSTNKVNQDSPQSVETRVVSQNGEARAKAYLNDVGRKIRVAIADGEMTEEEGRLKYAATVQRVKKRMAGARGNDADGKRKFTRKDYMEAVAKMQEMVNAGEITCEQMLQRLERMRKAMAEQPKKITREDFAEAVAEMNKMVEAGKITKEEMRERLSAMRRAIGESNRGQDREEISDDCMELRKKLGEAVRSGEMTREEAGKIWGEEGC